MKKKKIRTQNIHEFRSSFILNMNKKEYKSRKFNHNNTNLEKKNYRQETFLAFSYSYNQTQITSKNIQPNTTKTSHTHNQTPPKPATHTHTHTHTLWRFGHGGTPIPNLPWTSHPKPYLLCLQLRLWFDFPRLSHIAKLCSSCPGFFCFCFFERMWSFFYFMGLLCVCFPRKFLDLWVCQRFGQLLCLFPKISL